MVKRKRGSRISDKGIWITFIISFILPVIGGLLIYAMKEKKNPDLANINFILSLFHPFLIGILLGVLQVSVLWILLIPLPIFLLLKKNKYSFFTFVYYYGLFGLIAAYFKYKNKRALWDNAVKLFFVLLVLNIVLMTIVYSSFTV